MDSIIKMFGAGNPKWLKKLDGSGQKVAVRTWVQGWTRGNKKALYGAKVGENVLWEGSPEIKQAVHVFPVYSEECKTGFMIPLEISRAKNSVWHVSDAFGRFSRNGEDGDPGQMVEELLELVEGHWKQETPLLIHARRPLSLSIACPVHMDAIGGESLQVPLLVALLRAAIGENGPLPWGDGPVFSSGKVDARGVFQDICHLPEKLTGFVREYGKERPAVLTDAQREDLKRDVPESLDKVLVLTANSISELLSLDELGKELKDFAGKSPELPEIPGLAQEMGRLERSRQGKKAKRLAKWVLPHVTGNPVLRFPFLYHKALSACHEGRYRDVAPEFDTIRKLLIEKHPDNFGVNDRIRLAAGWATEAFDNCDDNPALSELFEKLEEQLPFAAMEERARFWGARSQFLRMGDDHKGADEAARKAVDFAKAADPRETGRDRNYLVHALLRQAAILIPAHRKPLLCKADLELEQSVKEDTSNIHQAFCEYYRGEIERLSGKTWKPVPDMLKDQEHPKSFAWISAARNAENSKDDRILSARKAADSCAGLSREHGATHNIFRLFSHIFRFQEAVLAGKSGPPDEVQTWLDDHGSDGWKRRLDNPLKLAQYLPEAGAESLCDAIPHL